MRPGLPAKETGFLPNLRVTMRLVVKNPVSGASCVHSDKRNWVFIEFAGSNEVWS
jgi:hypothetical protein